MEHLCKMVKSHTLGIIACWHGLAWQRPETSRPWGYSIVSFLHFRIYIRVYLHLHVIYQVLIPGTCADRHRRWWLKKTVKAPEMEWIHSLKITHHVWMEWLVSQPTSAVSNLSSNSFRLWQSHTIIPKRSVDVATCVRSEHTNHKYNTFAFAYR